MEYLAALAGQRVVNVEASSRAILDQVIAGEYAIGLMSFNHHTVISAQKGAPSDWLKLEPVPVAFDAVGILKDAPHPNAAKLFTEWLFDVEAQQVLVDNGLYSAHPDVKYAADRKKLGDLKLLTQEDTKLQQQAEQLKKAFTQAFGS